MSHKIFKPVKSNIIHYNDIDAISEGLFKGYSWVNRFGRNLNISTAGNEDICEQGGLYSGFPMGDPEEFVIELDNPADIGCYVQFRYLADFTSETYTIVKIQTTGLTTNTGHFGVRAPRAKHDNGSTFNTGNITIRHITTTANVFCVIPAGLGQTRIAGDTIPFNGFGLVKNIVCELYKNQTTNVIGALWVRKLGESPVLLREFTATNENASIDYMKYGGIELSGWHDFIIRIDQCSSNNTSVFGKVDFKLRFGNGN